MMRSWRRPSRRRPTRSEARARHRDGCRGRGGADAGREEAEVALRQAAREHAEAGDEAERAAGFWSAGARARDEGPESARRAGLSADLRGEQRLAERAERERAERADALDALHAGVETDIALTAAAERVAAALGRGARGRRGPS